MTKTEVEAAIHLHLEPLGGPIEKFKDEYDDDDDLIANDDERLDDDDMDEDDIEDSDYDDD